MKKRKKRFTSCRAESLERIIREVNDKISFINSGGCGFLAGYLADALSRIGYHCRIICLDSFCSHSVEDHRSNLKRIRRREEGPVHGYNHLCVQVGNYLVDSECIQEYRSKYVFGCYTVLVSISRDALRYLLSLEEKWNDWYDRSQNRALKRLITEKVSRFLR